MERRRPLLSVDDWSGCIKSASSSSADGKTDLLNLPSYPGHDQVQVFAEECARGIPDDTLADAQGLQAELGRRVALLTESQVTPLSAAGTSAQAQAPAWWGDWCKAN